MKHHTKLCTLDVSTGNFNDLDNEELNNVLDEYGIKEPSRIIPTMDTRYGSAEKITLCLRGGIVEYSGTGTRAITDVEGTVLSNPRKDIDRHIFDNENDFYVLCHNYSIPEPASPYSLYKYEKKTKSA